MAKTLSKSENPIIQDKQNKMWLWRYHLLPALLYLLGAIVFSWPLVLHLTAHVVLTGSGDAWAHLWNSWWARFSLLDLHTSPFHTDALYWPQGASLYFHALDPFTGYLSTPLQLLVGLVPAFNLLVLFEITLAGYAAMQLARYVTGNLAAAIVAGLIYAFSPLESLYLNLGQLELMSIGWLPLFMLFFIKTVRREPRWRVNFALSIVLLLIISLVTWYYLLYALIFAGLYTLYVLLDTRKVRRSDWLKVVGLAAGVVTIYLLLISPVLLPTLKEANGGSTQATQSQFNLIYNSADLQGFVWPGPSALWNVFGTGSSNEYRGAFLGFVTLLLAGFGLVSQLRRSWFWAVLGLIFLVLALGPILQTQFCYDLHQQNTNYICYDQTPHQQVQGITLPGQLISSLPFGSIARVPLRFVLLVMLSLAILAAFGIAKASARWPFQAKWQRLALPLCVGLLVFAEFLPLPRLLHDTVVSPFYTQIKNEGNWNDFALLETPDKVSAIAEYYQTVHNHPILGGYLSRKEVYPYDDTPGWYELRQLKFRTETNDIINQDKLINTPLVLAYYKIRYVVLHPKYLSADELITATDVLKATLGNPQPYYQDGELTVYRAPDNVPINITASQLVLDLQQSWNALENGQRSINGPAQVQIFNPSRTALTVKLTTQVQAKLAPHKLTLKLANAGKEITVGETTINPQITPLSFELNLPPGLNTLTFQPDADGKNVLTFGVIAIR